MTLSCKSKKLTNVLYFYRSYFYYGNLVTSTIIETTFIEVGTGMSTGLLIKNGAFYLS